MNKQMWRGSDEEVQLELTNSELISYYVLSPLNLIACSVVLVK
jgi:hypothetical protein